MRNIPEDNLAYPIFLSWDTGSTGSGFRLRHDSKTYFITAKHVLYDNENNFRGNKLELLCQTKDINDDSIFLFEVDIVKLKVAGMVFQHSEYDIAAFLVHTNVEQGQVVGRQTGTTVEGVNLVKKSETSVIITVDAKTAVAFIDEALVANDIFLYGYPTSLGLKHLPQFDYSKPLLRKGIIANVNKKQGTIILDCPVYYGNSGGPVVQVEEIGDKFFHKVIGVVSQFIPYYENWQNLSNGLIHTEVSNSGFSVAVAMDYVFEMLNITK